METLSLRMKHIFVLWMILISVDTNAQTGQVPIPEIGIVSALENDSLLYANGYSCIVEAIPKVFSPLTVSDKQFEVILEKIKRLRTPLYAVNIFIPGELKLVGPDVKEKDIISYVAKVFQRCQAGGVKIIVWGSGGPRRIPTGFDAATAKAQFIDIAKKISVLAARYDIILALENLNSTETNFITTLTQAYEIVKEVNDPHFRLCADIYHMLKEGEPAEDIEQTVKYLVHCDIAEKNNRTPPGTQGDDFKPYLKALCRVGYSKKIVIEARWDDLNKQALPAREYLQHQLNEVYRP
jgi:sugar phosphate isomerase/epimerase